jgi:hypothetical protein
MIKKTKILILYQYDSHQSIINCIRKYLDEKSFEADFFNTKTYAYSGKNSLKLKLLQRLVKIPKIRVIVNYIVRSRIILNISKKYQLIDIHYFSEIYDQLLPFINGKIKVTFWGSDLYRVSEQRRKQFSTILKKVSIVQVTTPLMESYFNQYNDFNIPITSVPLGIQNFENIQDLKAKYEKNEIKSLLNLPKNKFIITIGYNANPSQQHFKILEQLSQLQPELKEKCFLIVPFTYAGNKSYIQKIKKQLETTNINHFIIDKFLDSEIKNMYTLSSDIAINIQITDGFSASLQEHILTENIMLLGSWLPYNWLKERGINYIEVNDQNISQQLENVIINFDKYKKSTSESSKIIYSISSWNTISNKMNQIYSQLIQSIEK